VAIEAQTDIIKLHLQIDDTWSSYEQQGRAQNVLMFLNTVLKEKGFTVNNIEGLGVVMEGNSFTATRIITVIANTIGFMKDIQVRSLPKEFEESENTQKNTLWSEATPAEFVLPQYSGEPTITIKKPATS